MDQKENKIHYAERIAASTNPTARTNYILNTSAMELSGFPLNNKKIVFS